MFEILIRLYMNTSQLSGQFEEDRKKLFETGKLGPGLLRGDSAVIHEANDRLETIETSNLIFVFSEFSPWSPVSCTETN